MNSLSISAFCAPVDSIVAAGKLFLHEIDSAINLVKKIDPKAAANHAKGRDEEFSCADQTKMYLCREVGISLAKGMCYWWFDIFSGHYDDPALVQELANIHDLQNKLLTMDNTNARTMPCTISRFDLHLMRRCEKKLLICVLRGG